MTNFSQIKLGRKPDVQDHRDIYKVAAPVPLPKAYTVTGYPDKIVVLDQGQHSSCTGHATAAFWQQIMISRGIPQVITFSPTFNWYFSRKSEGTEQEDDGVQLRSALAALNTYGLPPIDKWPEEAAINLEPNELSKIYAFGLKLDRYERCNSLADIKYALAIEDQSVCLGIGIFESWYGDKTSSTGHIDYDPKAKSIGGHALLIVGYNDRTEELVVLNSWGTSYGDKGYVYVPYAMLEGEWFDAWTAAKGDLPPSVRGS